MNQRPRPTQDDSGSMHGTLLAVAVLMIALLLAPKADAQPRPEAPHDAGRGQTQTAVPEWVVPGARITQYAMSSQHTKRNRARDNRWREDDERARQRDIDAGLPADEVERRARQREEQRASDRRLYNTGTGGYSYVQYDIVAITEDGVLMEVRFYTLNPATNNLPELSFVIQSKLYDHATGGGLWVTPAMIQRALDGRGDGISRAYRAPYTIGEHTYDAVAWVLSSGDTVIRQVYDTATGIQLYQSQITDTDDLRSHQSTELAGYRVSELPWVGTRFTEQVRGLRGLAYEGAFVAVMPQTPGLDRVPDNVHPMKVSIAIQAPAADAIDATTRVEIQGLGPGEPTEQEGVLSPSHRLGIYIAPEVLAGLERGQVLDEDPVIGYSIRVTDIYQVDGVTLVELTEQGQANTHSVVVTYDARVGLQVAYVGHHPSQMRRIELNLTGVE
ncbi:hypothetical protein OT109_12970 [Phycisphaeraceae bacterium D3-23]